MIFSVGEILFDVFPKYRRIGGAPFNFAYHLKKLKQSVRFISRIGSDPEGDEILEFLSGSGFDLQDIQVDADHPTGRVSVDLDPDGVPSFHILSKRAYDYISEKEAPEDALKKARLIYFGTLVQRTASGSDRLKKILAMKNRNALRLYDVNLRPGNYSPGVIGSSLEVADIVKLNDEELTIISEMFGLQNGRDALMKTLCEKFQVRQIALTCGKKGSVLFEKNRIVEGPIPENVHIADTVGAGDAYCAMLALGILNQWPMETTLERCMEFAAQICGVEGAIPADEGIYTQWLPLVSPQGD